MMPGNRLRLPLLSILTLLVAACGTGGSAKPAEIIVPGQLPRGILEIQTRTGPSGQASIRVEIADSDEARRAGLMGRTHLDPDAGMVFLFDQPTGAPFWMKDTTIPLSIAFWGQDGRIEAMLDMVPCHSDPCPLYSPGVGYIGAVEVNRGFFATNGIQVGDPVNLVRG